MLISASNNFLYVSVPKAASTTIRTRLLPMADVSLVASRHIAKIWCDPHIDLETFAAIFVDLQAFDFFKFTTLREPLARLMSSYNYSKRAATAHPAHPAHHVSKHNATFWSYLCWLKDINESLPTRWPWGDHSGQTPYDMVMRLESIHKDLEKIPAGCCLKKPLVEAYGHIHNTSVSHFTNGQLTRREIALANEILEEELTYYHSTLPFTNFDKLFAQPDQRQGEKLEALFEMNHLEIYTENLRGKLKLMFKEGQFSEAIEAFENFRTRHPTYAMRLFSIYLNILHKQGKRERWKSESDELLYLYPCTTDDFIALTRYYILKEMKEEAAMTVRVGLNKFPTCKGLISFAGRLNRPSSNH